MTAVVMVVPSFGVIAFALCLVICSQLANETTESHIQPRWAPQPTRHIHPSWREYPRETLLQRAREASRQIALARRELALIDHFDWSALTPAIVQRVPLEHLPARQPKDLVLT